MASSGLSVAALLSFGGCASVVESAVDSASGVTLTERMQRDFAEFERRPINQNPVGPSFTCTEVVVSSDGVFGGPLPGARVQVFEDETRRSTLTTMAPGAVHVCVDPHTKRVTLAVERAPYAPEVQAFSRVDLPKRLAVTLRRPR